MTFLSPVYFWAFLALVPLLGIYFFKVRPRRVQTTALFLWMQIYEEKRRTSLFRRLRDVFSLLLMVIAFAAVALALTGPEVSSDERADLLLIVDHSVSMGAGGRKSSLNQAKAKAREVIRGLRGNQQAAVVTVATNLRFQTHLTDHPRVLLDAIDRVSPSTLPLSLDALSGLEQFEDDGSAHRVVLITDNVARNEDLPSGMEVMRVGVSDGNVGIVAADMQILPTRERALGLYFQLASTFEESRTFDVIVRRARDGVIGKLIEVSVESGINEPEFFTLIDGEAGAWELELDLEDTLSADNHAWLVAQQPAPVRVQIAVEDRYFFEKAVRAFEGQNRLVLVNQSPDVVVSMAATPDASSSLVFQPDGASPWWQRLGDDLEQVVPKILVKDHPVLRHVDVSSWSFRGARNLRAPDGALVLVESDLGVPLVYVAREADRVAVVVNMDPVASEFYFSAWFPVLIQGVATTLSARGEALASSYAAGGFVTLPGGDVGSPAKVSFPSGRYAEDDGQVLGPLTEFGFHRVVLPKQEWDFGVSMFERDETLLGLGHEVSSEKVRHLASGSPIAWWLTVLAMVVLVVESVLYHRRKVG